MDRKNSRNEKEIQDEENNSLTAFHKAPKKGTNKSGGTGRHFFLWEKNYLCYN